MPEANDETLSIWVKWLYTGRVFMRKEGDETFKDGVQVSSKEWDRWSSCYALGDFLQDPDFKDASTDTILEAMFDTNGRPTILHTTIYKHSPETLRHRKLAVDVIVNMLDRSRWGDRIKSQDAQFVSDVLQALGLVIAKGLEKSTISQFFGSKGTCEYHDHGSDKPCYRTRPTFRF
jgi:hypothetical protein